VPEQEHTFETPGPVRLDVKVMSCDVDVTSVDGAQSRLVLEGSQKVLDGLRIEQVGDRLVVEELKKSFFGRFDREKLELRAEIPHESRVGVGTASGDVELAGTFGGVDVKSASGDVNLTGELHGKANVGNVSGDVRITRVIGDLSVKTVSGDVVAHAVDGSISVRAVSSDLFVAEVHQGRVDVQTVSGDITLGIPAGTNVDVDAGSASGLLSSEIPLSPDGSGAAGDGPTVVIRANTVSGNVLVRRAASVA
jgi:Putative adhesin